MRSDAKPLATVAHQRGDSDLDYPRFIGDEAADRVGAEVPALRELADGLVLVARDAGSFKLSRRYVESQISTIQCRWRGLPMRGYCSQVFCGDSLLAAESGEAAPQHALGTSYANHQHVDSAEQGRTTLTNEPQPEQADHGTLALVRAEIRIGSIVLT